tara:strand:- start:996 stop:1664 length:669 start_codon:yes stop_codon:yes gene_type:complete
MYKTRQWGGGDAKLIMALGVVFSQYPTDLLTWFLPTLDLPFFVGTFFVNVLIAGLVYSLFMSVGLAIKHKKRFIKEMKKRMGTARKIRLLLGGVSVLIILGWFVSQNLPLLVVGITFALLYLFCYLFLFLKAVEASCMIVAIPPSKLQEGDWILQTIKKGKKILYNKQSLGVTKQEIQLLKQNKIKSIIIKKGIPFVPSFLIAAIMSWVFGDVLTLVLRIFI